ncbi:MAG: hypothetical protein R3325_13910, partial [Thermoanaerobaculia bacterium]|nr:hypothetical protein [Thermoanaerobaculia bacterium]
MLAALLLAGAGVLGVARAQDPYLPPLDAYMDTDDLPQDSLAPADDEGTPLAERIRVASFGHTPITVMGVDGEEREIGAVIEATLVVDEGFELVMPGLEEAFTIVVGEGELTALVTARDEETEDPTSPDNFPFVARLEAASFPLSLRLDPAFFRPVQPGTFEPFAAGAEPDPEIDLGSAAAVVVRTTWEGESSIELELGDGSTPSFSLSTPVMLGDTGIVLEVADLLLDLSETSSPPGIADPAWRGIQLGSFAVHWTNGLEVPPASVEDDGAGGLDGDLAGVTFTDFLIGTGGFSGTMCGNGLGIALEDGLFGMDFTIDELCVGFTRNALSEAGVTGTVTDFPYFETDVQLRLALDMNGNFAIGVVDPGGGLVTWEVEDILAFHLESVAFETREEVFLVRLNGDLEPLFLGEMDGVSATESDGSPAGGDFLIPVDGLTITSEGDVSIDGGWITLPQKRYIDFKAFQVTLSQIGFGKTEGTTEQSWFGFTGGVELVQGLDAEAEVKRLQFLWPATGDGPVDVRLEGVQVAYEQPGVLRFEGSL